MNGKENTCSFRYPEKRVDILRGYITEFYYQGRWHTVKFTTTL